MVIAGGTKWGKVGENVFPRHIAQAVLFYQISIYMSRRKFRYPHI
jgi:hypothetical protein